jgi:regulatory protein
VAGRRETFSERRERRAEVEDPAVVLEAAARFLEARPRSIAEIRRRLSTAGYRQELVDAAIGRLVDLGLVDDAEFARTWVASRDRARPRGEIALRRELQLKGVDRSIVDAVLAERGRSGDSAASDADLDGARRLLVRHARALAREPDTRRRRQRAYALLARHGFAPDVATRASREAVVEASDDEDAAG